MKIEKFDDLIGNSLTIALMRKALTKKSLSNLILLEGVYGTGKSSCAELIGMSLTCDSPINGEACNVCSTCKKNIEALHSSGVSSRLVKVNMAKVSKEGSMMEQIKDIFQIVKGDGNYVKILEEFHTLKDSDQKLILEETSRLPKGTYLILTTTNKRDILKEIVSRCLSFNFVRLSRGECNMLIDKINRRLKLNPSDYKSIYQKTAGVPRDIVLLVEFLSSTDPTREMIDNHLGVIGVDAFINILSCHEDFNVYHESLKELLYQHDLDAVYWQFRDFLNQLAFAIEGEIFEILSPKDLSLIPNLSPSHLFKILKIAEETKPNATEIELMFLKIRRVLAPAMTVSNQREAATQSQILTNPVDHSIPTDPIKKLSRFGGVT